MPGNGAQCFIAAGIMGPNKWLAVNFVIAFAVAVAVVPLSLSLSSAAVRLAVVRGGISRAHRLWLQIIITMMNRKEGRNRSHAHAGLGCNY